MLDFPSWQRENWSDYPGNPVIRYFDKDEKTGAAIGDPQVLVPGEFDSRWHCFYHGFYDTDYKPYYHHIVSDDGYEWSMKERWSWPVNPCFTFRHKNSWMVFLTSTLSHEERKKYRADNIIRVRESRDLSDWSEMGDVLTPELPFEREADGTGPVSVRNPCVVKLKNGRYRLYYSAGTVYLPDCGYEEPKYISFAEADSPRGPYVKYGRPIISPDKGIPHRNFGAGAIRVFGRGDEFFALYNSIYRDGEGRSRSAINMLRSRDGIDWEEAPFNPIIVPSAAHPWKSALVYQLDLVRWNGEYRVYYNARDGFREATEKIGVSTIPDNGEGIYKLWD